MLKALAILLVVGVAVVLQPSRGSIIDLPDMPAGTCPSAVAAMADFELARYAGVWYQYATYPYFFDQSHRCVEEAFEMVDEHTLRVNSTAIDRYINQTVQAGGHITVVDGESGVLHVALDNVTTPTPIPDELARFKILQTDYTNYAVIYYCAEVNNRTFTYASIQTRERLPAPEHVQAAEAVLTAHKLPARRLNIVSQQGCDESD